MFHHHHHHQPLSIIYHRITKFSYIITHNFAPTHTTRHNWICSTTTPIYNASYPSVFLCSWPSCACSSCTPKHFRCTFIVHREGLYNVVSHPGKSSKHKKLNKCSKYLDGGVRYSIWPKWGGECLFAHYTWINLVHDDSVFIYLTISLTTFFSPVHPNPSAFDGRSFEHHTSTLVSCFVR